MNSQLLFDEFVAEIDNVQSTLMAAIEDLTSPLGDLVRAQVKRSRPPICAAVVLAVAMPTTVEPKSQREGIQKDIQPEDDQEAAGLRHKRILLAAALEMLHVALNVHRLLVNAALREQQSGDETSLDPAFIGSTILAGDYCFSRAAQMAAQTDHPRVVAIFALALQTVSEGLLREQFHRSNPQKPSQRQSSDGDHNPLSDPDDYSNGTYDETRQLLHSGAHAAALLVGLPENEQQQAIALSHELTSHWTLYRQGLGGSAPQPLGNREEHIPPGWQALYHWLNVQHVNGEFPSVTVSRSS